MKINVLWSMCFLVLSVSAINAFEHESSDALIQRTRPATEGEANHEQIIRDRLRLEHPEFRNYDFNKKIATIQDLYSKTGGSAADRLASSEDRAAYDKSYEKKYIDKLYPEDGIDKPVDLRMRVEKAKFKQYLEEKNPGYIGYSHSQIEDAHDAFEKTLEASKAAEPAAGAAHSEPAKQILSQASFVPEQVGAGDGKEDDDHDDDADDGSLGRFSDVSRARFDDDSAEGAVQLADLYNDGVVNVQPLPDVPAKQGFWKWLQETFSFGDFGAAKAGFVAKANLYNADGTTQEVSTYKVDASEQAALREKFSTLNAEQKEKIFNEFIQEAQKAPNKSRGTAPAWDNTFHDEARADKVKAKGVSDDRIQKVIKEMEELLSPNQKLVVTNPGGAVGTRIQVVSR